MNHYSMKVLMVLLWSVLSVPVTAQTVSKEFRDTPLKTVLEEVQAQSGYTFIYLNEDVLVADTITASFKKASVSDVLDKVLGKNFTYKITGKMVSIAKVHQQPSATSSSAKVPPSARNVGNKVGRVKGIVIDASGEPVIGASVIVKGDSSKGGVITDVDGRFELSVPEGTLLEVSFIGYSSQTITADPSRIVTVVLQEDALVLEDVVVVGYGIQKKESVVGAISQIKTDDIVNTGNTNVTQAIAGKLSGVLTMQSSGQPGKNDAEIVVRGISSWNGSSPLVMVDGVERDFSSIDPNEIASISVLKDASATAVFGAKGANGVILVTTRTGEDSKARIKVNVSHGFNFSAGLPKHVSAYETAKAYNVAMMNSASFSELFSNYELAQFRHPSSGINSIRFPDNDWYELLLKDVAHSTDANVNLSGGNKKVRYFVSLGYKNEGSLFKAQEGFDKVNYNYDRLNYRANLDFNFTKTTQLSYKVGGVLGIHREPDTSPISYMYAASTIDYPAYYPEWVLEQVPDIDYPTASGKRLTYTGGASGVYYKNPYNALNVDSYTQNTSTKLYTDLILDQKLDFITEGLSANAKFSFSTSMSRVSEEVSVSRATFFLDWDVYDVGEGNPWVSSTGRSSLIEDAPYGASQGSISSFNYTLYWEGSLNYNRSWGKHHITALALFNQREYANKTAFKYRNQGVVGRVTYDYKHKYLFEGNVGYTGSEQFAPANRYGIFPSLAIGYVISNEEFWKNALPRWSKMKIRYSDGYVGNDQTSSRWLYFSSYSVSGGTIKEDSAANETARWETSHKRDIGLEMGWFDDKLTLETDFFDEHRTDMLVAPNVTLFVGANYKAVNKGEIQKHGLELELGWKDRFSNGLGYNINAMYSFNENRIVNYEDPPYAPDYQKSAGKAYGSQTNGVSVVDSGYFTNVDDIHRYPSYSTDWLKVPVGAYKFLDYSVDGIINSSDLHSVYGSTYPAHLYSFGGGINYKGWEFSFLFYGNYGKYVNFNGSFELDFNKGDKRLSQSMADYWTPVNQNAGHATLVPSSGTGHLMYSWCGYNNNGTSDMALVGRTWRSANYLSLRDVYLGKTFNTHKIQQKVGVSSLSLYLTANNLFYVSDLIEGNPETKEFTTGYYPMTSTVQIGMKVGF